MYLLSITKKNKLLWLLEVHSVIYFIQYIIENIEIGFMIIAILPFYHFYIIFSNNLLKKISSSYTPYPLSLSTGMMIC